jgi:hypothetical protein
LILFGHVGWLGHSPMSHRKFQDSSYQLLRTDRAL